MDNLYEKSEYINPNINFVFNKPIYEYDLKDAGFNIIREFKLLPDDIIEKLKGVSKDKRKIIIGDYQRKNPSLKESLKDGFCEARRRLFSYKSLNESNIVSIKKDAIFTFDNLSQENMIGKYLNFRNKNEYISYLRFSKKVEIYSNTNKCDIKGINHDNLVKHEDYMISFINDYIYKMETENPEVVLRYLRRFVDKYKSMDLSIGYYREFNEKSMYKTSNGYFSDEFDAMRSVIDIEYNLFNIIIPMAKYTLLNKRW